MPAQPSESHMCSQQPSESHMRGNEEMRQRARSTGFLRAMLSTGVETGVCGMWHVIGEVSTPVVGPF